MSLTDEIYRELMDGLIDGVDWQQFLARYGASKGPLYNAVGRVFQEIKAQVTALGEERAKLREELNQTGLKLDELNQKIKQSQSIIAPMEQKGNALREQIETLESKLAEKSDLVSHLTELEKSGFGIERLELLQETLKEIGRRHGLKGKEAVDNFFDDLKDYEAILEVESELERLQSQIETKKLEAENWRAKEEALKRKHDDLKEAIGTVHALRTRGVKVSQILIWHRLLGRFETVEQFDEKLAQYGDTAKLLNAKKEEIEGYEFRLAQVQGQLEVLQKEKVKIEAGIEALKQGGVEKIKAMAEEAVKQLKMLAASERREIKAVGEEGRDQMANCLAEVDRLLDKVFLTGEEYQRVKEELQKYSAIKDVLESHAVLPETAK